MRGLEAQLLDPDTGALIASWPEGATDADSGGQIGVMYVRSDVMMLGMVRRENADVFTSDGWYVTGDLCSLKRGHVHYHGRADDLIKAAGANVSPGEVETVLRQIEGVASVNVAAVPDRKRGHVVGAAIVPQPGFNLNAEAIRKEAARTLAAFKVPRVVVILSAAELPRLPSSKVDRKRLASLLQQAHAEGT
jgi:acyl-CoA synthetase (AMP-forming)/AMP-acid ligase II